MGALEHLAEEVVRVVTLSTVVEVSEAPCGPSWSSQRTLEPL